MHKKKLIKSSKLKRIWLWNQKRVYALVLQLPKYENVDKLNSFDLSSHVSKRDITKKKKKREKDITAVP